MQKPLSNDLIMPQSQPVIDGKMYLYGERAIVLESTLEPSLRMQKKFWALKAKFDHYKFDSTQPLTSQQLNGLEDIVLGNNNLTVSFNPAKISHVSIFSLIHQLWDACQQLEADELNQLLSLTEHHLTAHFDLTHGPDLAALAESKSLSCHQLIDLYCQQHYQVLFVGFLPGFAYLHGLPSKLHAPRLTQPRTQIPKGSIAIGGAQTGIYPLTSPGGWQIIGRLENSYFYPDEQRYNSSHTTLNRRSFPLLKPGDTVRFLPVT